MHNMLDMTAIEEMQLDCTSCKTVEKAMARCADCAQFLCPNCVSAHKYMRCFENHKVVKFEDIKINYENNLKLVASKGSSSSSSSSSSCSIENNSDSNDEIESPSTRNSKIIIDRGVPIHKPIFCKYHEKESLKFFCNTCQVN